MEAVNEQPVSLVSTVIGALTERIRQDELNPGDRLPSEGDIARELNVSRTVVREAFQSLAALRLIELNAGKRATIAELDFSSMAPLIDHGISTDQITIQQIYDVRRTIEIRTAALAALRRTDEQAELLCGLAEQMAADVDTPEFMMEYDLQFHQEIARASKNPVFSLIVGAFEGATRQTWPVGWRSRTSAAEQSFMLTIHLNIAQAIKAGDPQAAQTHMATHFDESVRALLNAGIL